MQKGRICLMEEKYQPLVRVGYAYVPVQELGELYAPEEALERGTLFPELDLPISVYGPLVK
ncbi:MAG: spore coat associated protein CotJA [Ruminococcaceae bacterium]|nr:spore coat associated protein CotJA [Oscillospiraceae bacterium]